MKFLKMSAIIAVILASGSCVRGQTEDFKLIIDYGRCQFLGRSTTLPVYFIGDIKVVDSLRLMISYNSDAFKLSSIHFDNTAFGSVFNFTNHDPVFFHDGTGHSIYSELKVENPIADNPSVIKITARMGNTANIEYDKNNPADRLKLFEFHFMTTHDRGYQLVRVPVQFIWESCDDNAIYYHRYVSGDMLPQSAYLKDVFMPYHWDLPAEKYLSLEDYHKMGMHTVYDLTNVDSCIASCDISQRRIYFFNGGADFACLGIDATGGDINLNGIANESADLIDLKDYLLLGDSVFKINKDGQYAASDVNGDGRFSTMEDFQYMIRYIQDDAIPFPEILKVVDGRLIELKKHDELKLYYKFDSPVGSILLRFNSPDSTDSAELRGPYFDYEIGQYWRNDTLSVLIYSLDPKLRVATNTGPLLDLKYTGRPPELISAEAAGFYSEKVDLRIIEH